MIPSPARTLTVYAEAGAAAARAAAPVRYGMAPGERLDFSLQLQPWLTDAQDGIATVAATLDGVALPAPSRAGALCTSWVDAPALGATARLQWRITTTNGRSLDRTVQLLGVQR